jgi:sortase A
MSPTATAPPETPGTEVAVARREALPYLLEALRGRRWARRLLSGLSLALLVAGIGFLAYPFGTDLYQSRLQSRLDRQLASPELRQAYRERRVATGDSLTRIRIPKIDVDVVVVEGVTPSALRAGAGHYPQTPLPCEIGNVAIAGHRTSFGKPFANVDKLAPGDVIILETPIGACTYEVDRAPYVVAPTDFSPIAPSADRTLTLTSCHPKGSAKQRIIVKARFVREGAAEA